MASIKVKFVTREGESFELEGESDQTLRDLAVDNLVPGLIGECGGTCSCGTCHVHIDPEWIDRFGRVKQDWLLFMLESKSDYSRLGCQIELAQEMDCLKVAVAAEDISLLADPGAHQEAYGIVNLSLGIVERSAERYSVTIFVNNLFDEDWVTSIANFGALWGNQSTHVQTFPRDAERYAGLQLGISF